jgi:hypothetical protein
VPKPSGFRFYHTHVAPMGNLGLGTYTGQAGPVYIEPVNNPGAYDRDVFLILKEFLPSFSKGGDMAMDFLVGAPITELQDIGKKADEQFNGPKGYDMKSATTFLASTARCSGTATRFVSNRASAFYFMC